MHRLLSSARLRALLCLPGAAALPGCATLGSIMSPYSEKFSCKNDDHGQCIHPDKAYEDAVEGAVSRSDPKVTNDRSAKQSSAGGVRRGSRHGVYATYRDSVYQELKGLIEAPVTPMLKPAQTVRTLILPYADRQRPDRLYMDRYVYSVVDKPIWVVGGVPASTPRQVNSGHVLEQVRSNDSRERPLALPAMPAEGDRR